MDHPLYPKFEEWYRSQDNQVPRLAFKDVLWRVFLAGAEASEFMQNEKINSQKNFFKSSTV